MFDIGWGEMIVIGVVALIAIGPKELPTVLRTIGQWTGKLRRMAGEFQGQFQEAIRESEIADLKKQFDDAANSVNSYTSSATNFDPLAKTRKEVESAFDFHSDASSKPPATDAAAATDTQVPSEVTPATDAVAPPTSEAVSLPPPDAPVPPPPDHIDIPLPEPAPLDPALTPASATPNSAAQPSAAPVAQPPAAQSPKEHGA